MHAMAKTVIPELVGGEKGSLDQLDDGLRAMEALPSLPPGLMPGASAGRHGGGGGALALEAPRALLQLPAPAPAGGVTSG